MAQALTAEIGPSSIDPRSGSAKAAPDTSIQPEITTIVLTVENMTCGGCMRKVETALSAVPGVAMARANLSARRVTVVSEATSGSSSTGAGELSSRLTQALSDAGFKSAEIDMSREDPGKAHERDLFVRMAVAGFAAANIMLLSVSVWSGDALGDMGDGLKSLFHWLAALVALPTVAYSGQPFFRSAISALSSWRINMDVPISLGVLLATAMSLFQTAAGDGDVYFDAAVMLLFFLLIGRVLDIRMRNRAAGAATNLLALRAISADVVADDGTITRLPAGALAPGMNIHIAPGERIAIDGTVATGRSDVDNALITGETAPQAVASGDKVYAGAINLSGALVVRADAVEDKTVLSEITRLMAAAEQSRGHYVRLADRAAQIYAPAVHILGLATFIGWMTLGFGWVPALTAAIAVLIITCPCALALAVPAVQVTAAGRLFDRGVVVKAADGLERLAACDWVVFDKTGTLTDGIPVLASMSEEARASLAEAASLAATSRHPYSQALVAAAQAEGLAVAAAADVVERPGEGLLLATPAGETRLGSPAFCGIEKHSRAAAALWFKTVDGRVVNYAFTERLKSDAVETITLLRKSGYTVEILSGDALAAVEAVAAKLGISGFHAELTPAEKVAHLEQLAAKGHKVLMVGDGLNDAPSLATAYASISPAEAADISQTAADAVIQGGRIGPVLQTLAVSKASEKMAFQNFGIALCYNAIFVPMAVVGFVSPLIAAIAMSASSIAVTANAIRLRTKRLANSEVPT